jgi:excisionase family DNA binding protein
MEELLTTRQVLELLKVDRITIYRMLQDGRLKGVKIGQQWRFPVSEVKRLLGGKVPTLEEIQPEPNPNFPTHCVQAIQDLFSEVGQISAIAIDLQGEPLTQLSRPSAYYQALTQSPSGREAYRETWRGFAQQCGSGSKYFTCHAGLQYAGAPIVDEDKPIGWFLVGQFYWQVPDPHEEAERIRRLASTYQLNRDELQLAARDIRVIEPDLHAQVEIWPFTAAKTVESILHERIAFMDRLKQIANLTQVS